ncbi:MAG TPA: GNAT family N-acetyltransferase [Candidatus Angelobacter sp.]|nr:GNAT family N-acetyltransferase [Candidatus Angelobacter sp.]
MSAVSESSAVARTFSTSRADAPLQGPVLVNPLELSDWDAQIAKHPEATFFHSAAWARVLCETYGHTPAYFCRFAGGELQQLLAVMEVSSPLTGRRGVALPFTDFCAPLAGNTDDLEELYSFVIAHGRARHWKYFEARGGFNGWRAATPSLAFFGHTVHLSRDEDAMFSEMDGAIRRGIRKAEQAGLKVEFGAMAESMETFFKLHCGSRRRHGVPPQPVEFFKNIACHVLQPGHGFVAVARHEGRAIASAVFFTSGTLGIYKFGASDYEFQQLRPNNLLMWEAIKHCAAAGLAKLHLGRTSLLNDGLRHFKLGFGAVEERIEYARFDVRKARFVSDVDRSEGPINMMFRCLPLPLLARAGRMLYPHLS